MKAERAYLCFIEAEETVVHIHTHDWYEMGRLLVDNIVEVPEDVHSWRVLPRHATNLTALAVALDTPLTPPALGDRTFIRTQFKYFDRVIFVDSTQADRVRKWAACDLTFVSSPAPVMSGKSS
jgi:hypothetical protein